MADIYGNSGSVASVAALIQHPWFFLSLNGAGSETAVVDLAAAYNNGSDAPFFSGTDLTLQGTADAATWWATAGRFSQSTNANHLLPARRNWMDDFFDFPGLVGKGFFVTAFSVFKNSSADANNSNFVVFVRGQSGKMFSYEVSSTDVILADFRDSSAASNLMTSGGFWTGATWPGPIHCVGVLDCSSTDPAQAKHYLYRDGVLNATSNAFTVAGMSAPHPTFPIGILTGVGSGGTSSGIFGTAAVAPTNGHFGLSNLLMARIEDTQLDHAKLARELYQHGRDLPWALAAA
jgi:hypothetical protein